MKKKQITIRLPDELMGYLESKVEDRTFSSMSHAIEVCVMRYVESEKEKDEG